MRSSCALTTACVADCARVESVLDRGLTGREGSRHRRGAFTALGGRPPLLIAGHVLRPPLTPMICPVM